MDINMNGLYSHIPSYNYSKNKDLYWCQNWTFRPFKHEGKIYMRDTFWCGDGLTIELNENNSDEFRFIFDFNDVEKVNYDYIEEFGEEGKDWFKVAIDSGGYKYPKYFIRKGAKRNKNMVIRRLKDDIKAFQDKIDDIELYINRIESGEIEPYNWS